MGPLNSHAKLQEMCSPLDAAFCIAKGKSCDLDLSRYETSNKKYLSFLTFSWGIIADIDIESEVIHWMGATRFDLWGVVCVAKLRWYRAKFSYLPLVADTTTAIVPPQIKMPALTEPVPSDWSTVEDDFILFWATHVTHAGQNMHIAPAVRPHNGFFTIMVVRYVAWSLFICCLPTWLRVSVRFNFMFGLDLSLLQCVYFAIL
jgi:sphingosine kinase